MKLNRPLALAIAVLTLVPWGYFVYFVAHFMSAMPTFPTSGAPPEQFMQDFQSMFRWQMLTMALVLALMVLYIVHLFNTDRVPSDKKALWAVVLLLGNLLAMPVYWFFYMWPRDANGAA